MNRSLPILAVCVLVLSLPLAAQERVVTFEPDASEVSFALGAMGHEVHGMFHLQSGTVRWDPETGTASGDIIVSALGAATGNEKRDKKMHKKVLESERFPLFSFQVEGVEGEIAATGSSTVQLIGSLSLHGDDHSLTVEVEVEVHGDEVEAVASFDVPYVEWGLRDPSLFLLKVAKSVEVTIEASGSIRLADSAGTTDAAVGQAGGNR
jgi:polyisoprenoid-binding protein YceI